MQKLPWTFRRSFRWTWGPCNVAEENMKLIRFLDFLDFFWIFGCLKTGLHSRDLDTQKCCHSAVDHLDPFPSSCLNILDVSWLSVLKPDSPGCQVAACLREWCCHSSLDPGTGLVCDTSGVWMCGTTMVWYVCMVWYVVCVPIVLLSTPQAPILRPNTKPYSTYWCIMPIPCTLVVLKLQHLSDAAWAAFVP